MYAVGAFVAGRHTTAHVNGMRLYAGMSLSLTTKLRQILTTFTKQEEFQMNGNQAVGLSADSHDLVVHIK